MVQTQSWCRRIKGDDADHTLGHESSISHDFSRGTDTVVVQTQSWCRRIKGDDADHTLSHESSISHDFSRGTDTVVVCT